MSDLPPNLLTAFLGIIALLVTGSIVTRVLQWSRPGSDFTELRQRVRTWWFMAGVFMVAMVVHRNVSIAFFGLLSFLALKEFLSMIPTRRADRRVMFWAYLAIPLQYSWVVAEWYGLFIIFIPVYAFLFLPMRMILIGETRGFLRAVGSLHWGLMTTVFSISHLAYLLVLPPWEPGRAGGPGLVLYLVLLTQGNDVAQYCWGKTFGRRRIVPTVSPKKTWEGFLGGVATTTALAVALAPLLTFFDLRQALFAGLLIGVAGFVGDVTISALKRDLNMKDTGSILPGHGGILDRLDSLTYTAPLFFHYVVWLRDWGVFD